MRNYVQLFLLVDVDQSGPTVIQYGFFFSQVEAIQYARDNPLPGSEVWVGPRMYYFLLNKWNIASYISQFPFGVDTDGFLLPDPSVETQDRGFARAWGVDSPTFSLNTNDPASVKAARIAKEKLATREDRL